MHPGGYHQGDSDEKVIVNDMNIVSFVLVFDMLMYCGKCASLRIMC